ncbi:hypothetical protein AMTRI_Chr11g97160 [Amborella trichopoda]|uniref:Ribosomal protein L21 n=1 Tax=Amborella trichopoda TaxID=13333 RepID=U5D9Q3_AMBTC|nr:50S ribosomal protein L21, chloroplastic [Amborella trichopoda]ERN18152.1 hypothetical protein AMTR_s00054p00125650 [Amborella trichopoda]|eukprot:XP_006856685.1 50S ribosomal protein L21, chloroplastic [Amborella trichopoda]
MASIFTSTSSSWGLASSFSRRPTSLLPQKHRQIHVLNSNPISLSLSSRVSLSRPPLLSRRPASVTVAPPPETEELTETEEESAQAIQPEAVAQVPIGEDVYAVVMVGSRQYIVFPGRFIYTQRLKDANVNDKIILNKVLLVGTRTSTYIGKPVVPNAAVHAVVEAQGLNPKVVVFKYKKKKNYRRNIGHLQPHTRIRITGITGYQDSPAATLA